MVTMATLIRSARRTLDRGVDGDPFRRAGQLRAFAPQVRDIAPAAEQRRDIAAFLGAGQRAVHIGLNAAVAAEILANIGLGGLERNA